MTPPPDLPYAPKRTRPLSLWNPLDYLTLLYWVFYFPQAIRWYVESFGSTDWRENGWRAVQSDPVQRRLAVQGGVIASLFPFLATAGLQALGLEFHWVGESFSGSRDLVFSVLGGAVLGLIVGLVIGWVLGVAFGVVVASLTATAAGIGFGFLGGFLVGGGSGSETTMVVGSKQFWSGVVGVVVLFSWLFAFILAALSSGFSVRGGLRGGWVSFALLGNIVGVFILLTALSVGLVGFVLDVSPTLTTFYFVFNLLFCLLYVMLITRADGAFIASFATLMPILLSRSFFPRTSLIPLYSISRHLNRQFEADWLQGVLHADGLIRYSLQIFPVAEAIHNAVHRHSEQTLLVSLVQWVSLPLYDWDIVRYQSASLSAHLQEAFWDGLLFLVPARFRPKFNTALRFDTPPRAACAAFWLLHEKRPAEAADAFAHVRSLKHGEELYANARAMGDGVEAKTLEAVAKWQAPPEPPDEVLRPTVRAALLTFGRVAEDAGRVLSSGSTHQRNVALSRATGALTDMLGRLEEYPTPERDNLETIAQQWREILLSHATEVGTLEVREAVTSPYIVGAIVPAARLVGRADIFEQLQAAWAKPGPRESLVIYGHRRMGKSSIARALLHFCHFGEETGLAVLNLQAVDWSGGMAYLAHAIAFELWRALPTSLLMPAPDDFAAHPVPALRGWLADLHATHPARRYLLILDEYELLEEKLSPAAARAFSTLLRGLTQQEPWLAVALVGLHTLQERSADIFHELFAWRTIPVGFMDAGAVEDALQVEEDDFLLEYDGDALARAHHLTGGQPFLVQLLGDSLVQRFNRHLRHDLTPPSPRFTTADVDDVTSAESFFEQGDAYFRGIWAQAGQGAAGQHALLRALAPHPDGLSEAAWRAAATLDAASFAQAKESLARHDVIICTGGSCRYTVELLRRWVANGAV